MLDKEANLNQKAKTELAQQKLSFTLQYGQQNKLLEQLKKAVNDKESEIFGVEQSAKTKDEEIKQLKE